MSKKTPTLENLLLQANKMLKKAPDYRSLCRGKKYHLVSVDPNLGQLRVKFESGSVHPISMDDVLAIISEIYRVREMPRGYFRDRNNSLRVLGRSYWHAPGAAILAILPHLDPSIKVDEKCSLYLIDR